MMWRYLDKVTDVAGTALDGSGMHQQTQLVFNPEVDWQPMQFKQRWSNMAAWLQSQYKSGSGILNLL